MTTVFHKIEILSHIGDTAPQFTPATAFAAHVLFPSQIVRRSICASTAR